jgi:hypothetical protein
MGRYYSGDIEGKFMFAIQDSDAADQFGSEGCQPNLLEYWFDEYHIPQIKERLSELKAKIGGKMEIIDNLVTYNDEELAKLGLTREDLSNYADYNLGNKILKCVEEKGQCSFTAEC